MNATRKMLFWCLTTAFWGINIVSVIANEPLNAQSSEERQNITWEEVKRAEQIPDSILSTVPTEELIQAYVDHRFTGLMFAHDNLQDGFAQVYNDFNGLREILKRKDASRKLIVYYQSMDPGAYDPNWVSARIGRFTFTFVFVEVLLAQEIIIEQLTRSEVKTLLSELLKKHESKTVHRKEHSIIGLGTNAFCIGRLIELKGKENGFTQLLLQVSGMQYLLKTGRLQNNDILPALIQIAKEFLRNY